MTEPLTFLESMPSFAVYDALPAAYADHLFSPFALTDAFIKEAGEKKQPILHFWTTPPLVILGMLDTKLPFLSDALHIFGTFGYPYMVRNSGGLAVVSDKGVLNMSIIFPEGETRLSINEGYSRMHQVIQAAFSSFEHDIHAYEITESYCPGEFDLSVDGKKIAGIAQRRLKGGIAIMIYLSVYGNQNERAQMIQDFYAAGLKETETKWHFPAVDPESMTTLEDALDHPFSLEDVKSRIKDVFSQSSVQLSKGPFPSSIHEAYLEGLEKMEKRNEKMLPDRIPGVKG